MVGRYGQLFGPSRSANHSFHVCERAYKGLHFRHRPVGALGMSASQQDWLVLPRCLCRTRMPGAGDTRSSHPPEILENRSGASVENQYCEMAM
jgi:hypothetical protein